MNYTVTSLVVYKNKAAIIRETGDKFVIDVAGGERARVREKDIEALHNGPVKDFAELEGAFPEEFAGEVWELYIESDETITLKDIAELAGGWTAKNAWLAYQLLTDGIYFEGTPQSIKTKPRALVEQILQKRSAKQAEGELRAAFLDRLRTKSLLMPEDARFLQDVEALALGKSEKSRTLKDIGYEESPQAAHRLLLELGVWDSFINPYPSRYGTALTAPKYGCDPPPLDESRADLSALAAFAVDDENSADPDDALSFEITDTGCILYVHVADPAASVLPGSPPDVQARERGATLYTPEGAIRMLGEDALSTFALGLSGCSPALTFKITLSGCFTPETAPEERASSLAIEHTEIFRSAIRVTRLSYQQACTGNTLSPLFKLAEANLRRRIAGGAVQIELPETDIVVKDRVITITPQENYPSRALVRECMLLAGEAAALWALENRLPFPFVSQEIDSVPGKVPPGYAGALTLRRCMRPRVLSVKPGIHQGLGMDLYTQVTSPLRRYTDLLAHQQISALLRGETPLNEDTLVTRLAVSERAAIAVNRAERASRAHWTAVYLQDKIGSVWEGVLAEQRGAHTVVLIPALGIETLTPLPRGMTFIPNSPCAVKLSSVKLPEAETRWIITG